LATARAEEAVLVTLDADIVPPPGMLAGLLRPILSGEAPVSSGYRWTIPVGAGLGTRLLALAEAGIGTLPRHAAWNFCWGGATALRRDALDLAAVWERAVSDDLMLTRAARAGGLVIYAPLDVRPPSPVEMPRLGDALRFGARQYRVLRLHAPRAHAAALVAAAVPVAGGVAALAALGVAPLAALGCLGAAAALQSIRARLRGAIARRVLPPDAAEAASYSLREAWLAPAVPIFQLACLLLGAGGGRWLSWAGRRYRIGRDGAVTDIRRVS
jgi:ceramide glucosyltransferase